MSDRQHGIAKMSSSDGYYLIVSSIPVFVMLLVEALYNSLNFSISLFAPLLALRQGNTPAE
jgi:hypothetical protein